MQEVTISKVKLLAVVEKNREQHIKEYNEAVVGYKEQAIKKIEETMGDLVKKVNLLKDGQFIRIMGVSFDLSAPKSFEDEYDQTIGMLNDSVDENIVLSREEYRNYMLDKWSWTESFKLSNMRYTGK